MAKALSRSEKMQRAGIIERYLRKCNTKGQGSAMTPERRQALMEGIEKQLADESLTFVRKLQLTQKLRMHEVALEQATAGDGEDIEAAFVKICVGYSEEHGIEYETWRELGVPARVLREAGW